MIPNDVIEFNDSGFNDEIKEIKRNFWNLFKFK